MLTLTPYLSSVVANPRAQHASTFRQKLGSELVDVLLGERILFDAGTSDWYPCAGYCGQQRPIIDCGVPRDRPFFAPCAIDDGCLGTDIDASELQLYDVSFSRFVEVVCRALGVSPASTPELAVTRGIHRLGTARRRGVVTEVFLAIAPDDEVFPLFVAARTSRPTWFVATTLQWVPDTFLTTFAPNAAIEISALDSLLEVRHGRIVATMSVAPAVVETAQPFATLIDTTGTRVLSRAEYEELVETASERFDLFVDVATEHKVGKRRFCKGGFRKKAGGRFHEVEIPTLGARAVSELMELARDAYVHPEKLPSLKGTDATQNLRRGWALIDPTGALRSCSNLAYRFQPRHNTRWAIVKRVEAAA